VRDGYTLYPTAPLPCACVEGGGKSGVDGDGDDADGERGVESCGDDGGGDNGIDGGKGTAAQHIDPAHGNEGGSASDGGRGDCTSEPGRGCAKGWARGGASTGVSSGGGGAGGQLGGRDGAVEPALVAGGTPKHGCIGVRAGDGGKGRLREHGGVELRWRGGDGGEPGVSRDSGHGDESCSHKPTRSAEGGSREA
jgi:hypothetical protein